MPREITYWITVGLVAIVAIAGLKFIASSGPGQKVPGLPELANFV